MGIGILPALRISWGGVAPAVRRLAEELELAGASQGDAGPLCERLAAAASVDHDMHASCRADRGVDRVGCIRRERQFHLQSQLGTVRSVWNQ